MDYSVNIGTGKLAGRLDRLARGPSIAGTALEDGFKLAGQRYLSAMRSRFVEQSQGGGEWPDLAVSTKVARMRGRGKSSAKLSAPYQKKRREMEKRVGRPVTKAELAKTLKFLILRDTGALFNSLSVGSPGNVYDVARDGIVVGTAISYARHHQKPKVPGRPPRRAIFVPPDDALKASINDVLKRAYAKYLQQVIHG